MAVTFNIYTMLKAPRITKENQEHNFSISFNFCYMQIFFPGLSSIIDSINTYLVSVLPKAPVLGIGNISVKTKLFLSFCILIKEMLFIYLKKERKRQKRVLEKEGERERLTPTG